MIHNIRSEGRRTELIIDVQVNGKMIKALLDGGSPYTLMDPRTVEKQNIPYRSKKTPLKLGSFEGSTMSYGNGYMRLETEEVNLQVGAIQDRRNIGITKLGNLDMIVGYDWLYDHDPLISHRKGTVLPNPEIVAATKKAGQRRPTKQSSPQDGCFGKISLNKIMRIYKKNPRQVSVLWIRRVAAPNSEPQIQPLVGENGPWYKGVPQEYRTNEFRELFEENEATDLPSHQPWDHEIPLEDGATLRPAKMYPIAANQEGALREYLEKNLKKGFIRESQSPMASPVLMVPKKNGKWRICIDYRTLNNATRKNRYPLPLIQELMDRLQGVKWITKFDVRDGFYRVRIARGHEWKTAFKTRYGLFEYTVMPMGLTNAPSTFQSVVNRALHEYLDIFVTAYLDDVLVYSRGTYGEHVGHVKKVLKKMKEYGLYLQPGKCEFHVKETEFLGFIISDKGVKMDPKKVEAVQNWEEPRSVKDVQSFLGFTNFYRKFIRNYSKQTAPLTDLTKKEQKFHWGDSQQTAFKQLKELFLSAPMLQMYDPHRPTRVDTDASDYALGAILMQQCEDGKWRPVFYHARKFTSAELNYDVFNKELKAVIDALEQWEVHLMGLSQPFEVWTDHQNLTTFTTTKVYGRRQARWGERLAMYDFKIHHRPGTLNGAADALSRQSKFKEPEHKEPSPAMLKINPDGTMEYNQPEQTKIRRVGLQVIDLQKLWQRKAAQWTFDEESTQHQEWSRDSKEHKATTETTNLRPYVPPDMRTDLIKELHESPGFGHPGVEEMVRRLARTFDIPCLRRNVEQVVSNCVACHENKPKRHKPYGLLQPLEPPTRPWTSVTMDFVVKLPASLDPSTGHTYDSILVIVCRLTKENKLIPVNETLTQEGLTYLFNKHVVADHGMPEEVITDRGSLFKAAYWKTYLAKQGAKGKMSTSFHPETDGQTERMNQAVEQYIRFYANKLQSNWVELLPTAQLALNSAVSSTTKVSPHYANKGYEPVAHRDPKDIESTSVDAEGKARKLQELHKELSDRIARKNLTTSKQANKKRIEGPTFKEGDKVFLSLQNFKTLRPSKKLDNLRKGAFRIKKVLGPVTFEIELPKGLRHNPRFHKKLLEPAPPETPLCTSLELEDEDYEVETILDLQKKGRQWRYLVKWKGWPDSQNTWEPESNLTDCKSLVQRYHNENPGQGQQRGQPERHQRKKKKVQPVTSPDQRTVRMVRSRWSPYPTHPSLSRPQPAPQEKSYYARRTPRRLRLDEHTEFPSPSLLEVSPDFEPVELQVERFLALPDASHASPPPSSPQTPATNIEPARECTQRSARSRCPRNNEGSSSRNDHNGRSSPPLRDECGPLGRDVGGWKVSRDDDGQVPWAWSERQGKQNSSGAYGPYIWGGGLCNPEKVNTDLRDEDPKEGASVMSMGTRRLRRPGFGPAESASNTQARAPGAYQSPNNTTLSEKTWDDLCGRAASRTEATPKADDLCGRTASRTEATPKADDLCGRTASRTEATPKADDLCGRTASRTEAILQNLCRYVAKKTEARKQRRCIKQGHCS